MERLKGTWAWVKDRLPNPMKRGKPHFNFITTHYTYMLGLTILGSIMIYPAGVTPYIDALFFAAGAATQSGLNTIDVNKMHTYQQVVLYFIACIANPIFINTCVVFIRLYWFEQRFDHIVKEARSNRRTRTRSRTVSESRPDADPGRVEMGVNGRKITVLHHTTKPNGMSARSANAKVNGMNEKERIEHLSGSVADPFGSTSESGESSEKRETEPTEDARDISDTDENVAPDVILTQEESEEDEEEDQREKEPEEKPADQTWLGRNPSLKREITFADQVKPSAHRRQASNLQSVPERPKPVRLETEHHIAFLERQRNIKDQGTLRIPNPREFDRGDKPHEVESDEEGDALNRQMTRNTLPSSPRMRARTFSDAPSAEINGDDHPVRRGIIIDEPERPQRDRQQSQSSDTGRSPRFNIFGTLRNFRSRQHGESTTFGRSLSGFTNRTFSFTKSQDRDMADPMPYLSWQPTIGRNSQFVDLSEAQREELGGIEYRALKTLALVLVCYFIGFHLLGVIVFVPWILESRKYGEVVTSIGQNRTWWGIFTPASMFNDLGFTLTPDSMISFQSAVMPLLFGSFLIIIGNTGFPCMLRFVIWLSSKLVPRGSGIWEELRFLLDHPRRCFTLLFPSKANWWLFAVLVALNGVDLIFFIILDLNDETVTSLSPGFRVLNGWFQAASTRTAGFASVNLADLHPAIQVSYLIMMYISVFPVAISVRRTNVYEEKSLGIFAGEEEDDEENRSYVGQHLRRQLSFDLWYIFLGFFIITIVEGHRLEDTNAYAFTMFSVLFEIVSAYGTVGLSLGYPTINASFSAEFATLSKLIIIAMMIRGRHRGLPYALDRAILLPSENLNKNEEEGATVAREDSDEARPYSRSSSNRDSNVPPEASGASMDFSPTGLRHMRRGSQVSTRSAGTRTQPPTRRMSKIIMSGLSAGPTMGRKYD
ncbi:potassium transport protein TRK1/TRK2 [Aureobasidium pullulans]|uniref:Potassium transport protein n=2 Tax=Aureobasidium pullulans TaxID=5580 RepID=A0A074X5D2_AURPU|nr:potassium transport protein TRK1/TRK2 [Aureobasidium pullulans EXF-150]THV75192.1 potassium transport protein TRK1/TRK2 [Aureobasidium pullulans]KEQ80583.1 potassium transport protein TRK1/TRK2 [Aureobasidium pullulans EXF-150]THW24627.1 potassium transport protein TRK1/TRK2 [Aureobasidium pullulans]THW80450.1 potassium transport protein TRK1/TRK2 [Aureobasidium pullulans]THX44494.1 potassium transport protein TRK1/TRK2 [Aureobasidium pullulans]